MKIAYFFYLTLIFACYVYSVFVVGYEPLYFEPLLKLLIVFPALLYLSVLFSIVFCKKELHRESVFFIDYMKLKSNKKNMILIFLLMVIMLFFSVNNVHKINELIILENYMID